MLKVGDEIYYIFDYELKRGRIEVIREQYLDVTDLNTCELFHVSPYSVCLCGDAMTEEMRTILRAGEKKYKEKLKRIRAELKRRVTKN